MRTGKILEIRCKCGALLFRYLKVGKGRIIKCMVNRIETDYVGLKGLPTFSKPQCPECGKDLGIIMMIHGEPSLKLNQGSIASIVV